MLGVAGAPHARQKRFCWDKTGAVQAAAAPASMLRWRNVSTEVLSMDFRGAAAALCILVARRSSSTTATRFSMERSRSRKRLRLRLCCVGARPAQKRFRMELRGASAGDPSVSCKSLRRRTRKSDASQDGKVAAQEAAANASVLRRRETGAGVLNEEFRGAPDGAPSVSCA